MKTYTLPLSPDYVSDWNDWHATRELLQNAMDAHDSGAPHPKMDYDGKTLCIASPGQRLPRRSLLLGNTTKTDIKSQRGKFGEGYKLALLVFARKHYDIVVQNGGEIWSPFFRNAEEFDNQPVLTIDIRPAQDSEVYDGVAFHIKGIPPEAWKLIESRWLPDATNDTILRDPEERGNIYSGGLFVTQHKKLLRGYNFAPHRLNLGRDRDIVGDFDIKHHTAQLWSASRNIPDLIELMRVNAADVEYVNYVPQQDAQLVAKAFEKEYGQGTVPVADQKELDQVRSAGFNAQIVPHPLRTIVKSVRSFIFHEERTPYGKLKRYCDKHKESMNILAREELEFLVQEAVAWR